MEQLVIIKNDLEHNINVVKEYIKEHCQNSKVPKIIGVVKANGYGMDVVKLSNVYIDNGIDVLAVSKLEEAVKLRENNIYCDILFLSSTCIQSDVEIVIDNNIIPTIGSVESLKIYEKIAKEKNEEIDVHIKLETGFSRHGISKNDLESFVSECKKCEHINIVGIFTHFSQAFVSDSIVVKKQYDCFEEMTIFLKESLSLKDVMLHVCNSSATFKYPKYYLDAVRVGSAFIGSLPFNNNYGLKKIGYLQTRICEIKKIDKGSTLGYGDFYVANKDMVIGIVQSGYTSGIGISIENNTFSFKGMLRSIKGIVFKNLKKQEMQCEINGKKYNIVSNIRMNNIIVDISNSNVKVGDLVKINVYPSTVDTSIERKYI